MKEEIEGEEEGCKTKQKCEEITLFGESGNQITSAMHEENLIKNGNYSVNKRLNSKGKVGVKEKGKGKKNPTSSQRITTCTTWMIGFTAMTRVFRTNKIKV